LLLTHLLLKYVGACILDLYCNAQQRIDASSVFGRLVLYGHVLEPSPMVPCGTCTDSRLGCSVTTRFRVQTFLNLTWFSIGRS